MDHDDPAAYVENKARHVGYRPACLMRAGLSHPRVSRDRHRAARCAGAVPVGLDLEGRQANQNNTGRVKVEPWDEGGVVRAHLGNDQVSRISNWKMNAVTYYSFLKKVRCQGKRGPFGYYLEG